MLKRLLILTITVAVLSPTLLASQANDLDPSRIRMAESATDKGNAFLKKEKYERAEGEFRRAIEHEKRYPSAHLGLGATLVATARFDEAVTALQDAEQQFADWLAMNQVAGLQNRQAFAARERKALDAARQSGASNTGSGNVNTGAVMREVEMERHMADRIRPEDVAGIPAQVFYLKGLALLRIGSRDQGIESLLTCLYIDRKHALSHYNLSVAFFTGGELQSAKQHLDAAIENGASPHPQFVADLDAALNRQAPS